MKLYVSGILMTIIGFSGMRACSLESPIAMLWILLFSVGLGIILGGSR